MSVFVVDVEADGPIPGDYSMIEVGAVLLKEGDLDVTFHAKIQPISDRFSLDALRVTGYTREDTLAFPESADGAMARLESWVYANDDGNGPIFISDNNGFDWMFVCWYMWHFLGRNVFGYSSANINYIFKGLKGSMKPSFKKLRKTKHTHNPVDDATGNAEALLAMVKKLGFRGLPIAPAERKNPYDANDANCDNDGCDDGGGDSDTAGSNRKPDVQDNEAGVSTG